MPSQETKAESQDHPVQSRIPRLLAIIGITFGVAVVAAAFWGLRELRDAARLASCRPYVINWVVDHYTSENEGMYPPLSSTPGRLMFFEDAEGPDFRVYSRVDFICEADKQDDQARASDPNTLLDDWSYVYLGYVIEDQEQLEAFADAYKHIIAEGGDFTSDLKVDPGEGNCGSDTIYRLREREQLLALLPCLEGRLDEIPVVIEWPENHRGPVAKVVTMEHGSRGEVMNYPSQWPMTEEAIVILRELDAMGG